MLLRIAPFESINLTAWRQNEYFQSTHVWLHVDVNGHPFFVGRGQMDDAWDVAGGPAWEHYISNYLGGEYFAAIPHFGLTSETADELKNAYMARYQSDLLNQRNPFRPATGKGSDEYYAISYRIRSIRDELKEIRSPALVEKLAKEAVSLQLKSRTCTSESGRFGEMIGSMGAQSHLSLEFLDHLIKSQCEQRKGAEAIEALDAFVSECPSYSSSAKLQSLMAIARRGRYVRRRGRIVSP